jgi:serine/threonine protein kinase
MVQIDPAKRSTAAALLTHPWLDDEQSDIGNLLIGCVVLGRRRPRLIFENSF